MQKRQTLFVSKSQEGFIKSNGVVITIVPAKLVFEIKMLPQNGDIERVPTAQKASKLRDKYFPEFYHCLGSVASNTPVWSKDCPS